MPSVGLSRWQRASGGAVTSEQPQGALGVPHAAGRPRTGAVAAETIAGPLKTGVAATVAAPPSPADRVPSPLPPPLLSSLLSIDSPASAAVSLGTLCRSLAAWRLWTPLSPPQQEAKAPSPPPGRRGRGGTRRHGVRGDRRSGGPPRHSQSAAPAGGVSRGCPHRRRPLPVPPPTRRSPPRRHCSRRR